MPCGMQRAAEFGAFFRRIIHHQHAIDARGGGLAQRKLATPMASIGLA